MNRRNFLSTIVAAGVAATVSPLLAIPPSNSPVAKPTPRPGKMAGVTGPLIRIKAANIRVDTSEDEQRNDLFVTTKNGDVFTFRCGQMADRTTIKRVVDGKLIDTKGFYIGLTTPRLDVYEQTARDPICKVVAPEYRARVEWREISYV